MPGPDWSVFSPLWLSLKVAGLATVLAGLAGMGLGWWMAHGPRRGALLLDSVFMLPLVLPPTVLGYYLIVLIGRNGLLGRYLDQWFGVSLIFTWQGATLAAAIVSFPLIYKAARAAFEEVDARLEDAARTLGASEPEILLRVTLPLAVRGLASGLMLSFARAIGEFGATLMVAGNLPGKTQTLSVAVYDAVQAGQDGQALWLTAIISIVCLLVLVASGRLLRARH